MTSARSARCGNRIIAPRNGVLNNAPQQRLVSSLRKSNKFFYNALTRAGVVAPAAVKEVNYDLRSAFRVSLIFSLPLPDGALY
jgi:hypothetical protein